MEDSRTEKLEVLETPVSYNDKVIPNIGRIIRTATG